VTEVHYWVEFLGGADSVWLLLMILSLTQVIKMGMKSFGAFTADRIRIVPYLVGSFAAWVFIGFSTRASMIGIACGGIASFAWFAIAARFEYGSWKEAGPEIAKRMLSR